VLNPLKAWRGGSDSGEQDGLHMTLIESHRKPEVALLDSIRYRVLRAATGLYAQAPEIAADVGLTEELSWAQDDPEARYTLGFVHYMAGSISMARAAELVDLSWLELHTRCLRLDVPLRTGPNDAEGSAADIVAAREW